jgi:bile acid:Na+ symporter, BASS family
MNKIINLATIFFPVWMCISVGWGLFQPDLFAWLTPDLISLFLGLIMLFMGMTLTADDFSRVLSRPLPIAIGVALQYTIMPLSGFAISRALDLDPATSSGLILVASCPGGTASNVLAFIARADVALSVTLTLVSTLLSVILTPFLASLLIGSTIQFNSIGLFETTLKIVVLPLFGGMFLSKIRHMDLHWFPLGHRLLLVIKRILTYFKDIAPLTSIVMIILIVSSILASSRDQIFSSPFALMGSVFLLHASGFFWGYIIVKRVSRDSILSRTISLEVGMQNSGLGVVLALANFTDPFVAVPPAISSLFHSLIASFLAAVWNRDKKSTESSLTNV